MNFSIGDKFLVSIFVDRSKPNKEYQFKIIDIVNDVITTEVIGNDSFTHHHPVGEKDTYTIDELTGLIEDDYGWSKIE